MKVIRYKMIYVTKIDEKIKDNINPFEAKLLEEIDSENIRILGKDFVKNNINFAKLVINTLN